MPQVHYALIATSGIDTVLIASTPVGQNSTSATLKAPHWLLIQNTKPTSFWAITDTHILYALLNPALDNQDGSPGEYYQYVSCFHSYYS